MIDQLVRNWMSTPVITVSPLTTVTEACKITADRKIRALPVMEGDQLVGIITRRDLLRLDLSYLGKRPSEYTAMLPKETIGDLMTRNPITIDPELPVPKAARIMLEKKISALPVVENGRLVGIITNSDLLRFLLEGYSDFQKKILASKTMTSEVVTVKPDCSLLLAHELMGTRRIRCLPVVENGELKGIVTRSDLLGVDPSYQSSTKRQPLSLAILTQPVKNIMSTPVITTSPQIEISEVARLMIEQKLHSLPVVDETSKMVGIITESDLFKVILELFE